MAKERGPVWIWDPNAEWAGPVSKDAPTGFALLSDWNHALHYLAQGGDAKKLVWQVDKRHFAAWCNLVRRTGKMLAVIDEAHDFLDQRNAPDEAILLVRRTRHSRVRIILIAQRPTGIHVSIRSQVRQVISFAQSEASDLRWFDGTCGIDMRERVQALNSENHEFAHWEA